MDSEQLDDKILALRAAQNHSSQARELHEKANTLQEFLDLQTLHSNVTIIPAYITTLQTEIEKLQENARQEVRAMIMIIIIIINLNFSTTATLYAFIKIITGKACR